MCQLVLLIVLLTVAVLAGAITLAGMYFGLWGVVGVIGGFVILAPMAIKLGGKALLTRFALGMFDKKSRVLRDAQAETHAVTVSDAPSVDEEVDVQVAQAGDDGDGEEDEADEADEADEEELKPGATAGGNGADDARHYLIDVTIKPKSGDGPFQHWDIDDLTLVPFDLKVTRSADGPEEPRAELCEVRETQVWDGKTFIEPEGSKFTGPQRLRLRVAVKPEPGESSARYPRRLKFRYYFEAFGDVALP